MKVAIIGSGNVGKSVFRELQNFREVHKLVLVSREEEVCRAEVEDYNDAIPLRVDSLPDIEGGGYELTKDADILIYCAGPSITAEERLSITDINIEVMKEVFTEVDKYAPDAIVIAVTNPLDVITTAIQKFTGRPASKVIGTGTLLDSSRLKKILSWAFQISPRNVTGMVIGEHGWSSVVLWSGINILGMSIEDYMKYECDGNIPIEQEQLDLDVRDAGFKIFRGKGYTSAGVAAAVARIVFDIVNDTREMYPVSTVLHGEYGVDGFAISVPCMIGAEGILGVKQVAMSDSEKKEFQKSVDVVKEVCRTANLLDEPAES